MATKGTVIGAASVGGIVGIWLTGELSTGALFAASTGENANKVYDKTLELNAQYDVLPKVKSLTDTVVTASSNLDKNYGITAKVDEQLKLSASVDKALSKVDELKANVQGKVEDLKSK